MGFQDFRTAYITALLWSETDCRGDGDCSCNDCGNFEWATEEDIATDSLEKIDSECRAFYDAHSDSFERVRSTQYTADEQAGHDFCLTRNGHGAGFWDGDWPTDLGKRLTEASHAFGEVYLTTGDDGKIYV